MKLPEPVHHAMESGVGYYSSEQMLKYRADAVKASEAAYVEAVRLHSLTLDDLRVSESENFQADAHKLALALKALLMSAEDDLACAKWWDMAHHALDQHRQLVDKTYPQEYVSAFRKD